MNLEMLNDDCLRCISQSLNFYDRIAFGTTCQRFSQIIHTDVAKRYITWEDIDKIAKRLDLQLFFSNYGADIRRICLDRLKDYQLPFLAKYCPNLEYLELRSPNIDNFESLGLFTNFPYLRNLKLIGFCYQTERALEEKIRQLRNLEVLHIVNQSIAGKCWLGLTTLTELYLLGCHIFNTDHFIKIIESNKSLKKVSLPKFLEPDGYRCLARIQHSLEYLSFDDGALHTYNFLADLRPLKHVNVLVDSDFQCGEKIIRELGLHHADSLEALSCRFRDELVFPTGVSLPRLSKLYLKVGDFSDLLLNGIDQTCSRLEWFRLECQSKMVTGHQLVDFLNHNKTLAYIDVPLDLFTISLYRQIVNVRRHLNASKPLTLVLKYSRISFFIKQQITLRKEYPEQTKFVKICLKRYQAEY